jgi:hypothetical protein
MAECGAKVSAELEAIVRDCLEKKPEARPQSAVELRRRLAACSVEAWDAEKAEAWWNQHQRQLDRDAASALSTNRTIAVDGRSRALLAPAG